MVRLLGVDWIVACVGGCCSIDGACDCVEVSAGTVCGWLGIAEGFASAGVLGVIFEGAFG
jgi:hypothetical protein